VLVVYVCEQLIVVELDKLKSVDVFLAGDSVKVGRLKVGDLKVADNQV
jgi:hypothetical protein